MWVFLCLFYFVSALRKPEDLQAVSFQLRCNFTGCPPAREKVDSVDPNWDSDTFDSKRGCHAQGSKGFSIYYVARKRGSIWPIYEDK